MKAQTQVYMRWIGCALASALVMCGTALIAPHVVAPPFLIFATAFVAVIAATLVTAWAAPPLQRSSLIGVLVAIAALEIIVTVKPERSSMWAASVVLVSLLLAGTAIGTVIGRAIQHAGQLLIVGVVFTLADTFSVFHPAGPSAVLVESTPNLISILALPWPLFGSTEFVPVLGVGDVTAAALFIGASRVHELSIKRTVIALVLGLVVTMLIVWYVELPIPALPLMSFAVIAAHPQARRLRAEDRRPALIGFLVMAALYVLAWLALSSGTTA